MMTIPVGKSGRLMPRANATDRNNELDARRYQSYSKSG